MIVKELNVRQLKNVLDASFEFDNWVIKISGKNWAGKSTIIDAIWFAIIGKTYFGKWKNIENIITKWKDKTEVSVKLVWDNRDIKITRKANEKWNDYLDIWTSDWSKLTQKDLNLLLSEFTVDPLDFIRKTVKEQYEIVKEISWIDTVELDKEIETVYNKRTVANMQLKQSEIKLQNFWKVEKVEKIDISELLKTKKEADASNFEIRNNKKELESFKAKKELLEKELQEVIKNVALLEWILDWTEIIDTTEIEEKINNAQSINEQAIKYEQLIETEKEYKENKKSVDELESKINNLRQSRKEMIENAKLPIDNMEFNEKDWVIIDWIPFNQYSSAQQLIISTKIAISINPELKVIYIKDWSLLDNDTLKDLEKFVVENDYQIFIERVWEEYDSIIMRDWEYISDKKSETEDEEIEL